MASKICVRFIHWFFLLLQMSFIFFSRIIPVLKNLIRVFETVPLQSNTYSQFIRLADFEGSKPSGYILRWPFLVQGSGNAHILTTSKINPTEFDDAYEIVIGAWENHHIIIRKRINGAVLADVHVPHVLSESKPTKFVLDILEGKFCLRFT